MKERYQIRWCRVEMAIIAALLTLPADAAPGAVDVASPSAAVEAAQAAEDVTVLKALASLGLTRSQLAQLLPSLRGAQDKLNEFEGRETEELAALRAPLEQAKQELLTGKGSGLRAQEQFSTSLTALAQRRAGARAEVVASLRRTLDSILNPAQAATLAESGQAVLMTQRAAGWRGGGGPGRGGEGPGGSSTGRLDRIRQMSPAEFERDAGRWADRMGGRQSAQFQQYMAHMQNVRSMPHSQYLLQRDQLAARSSARGGAFGAIGNPNEAANAIVDRYLLSPRAPVVVADRLAGS
jgi:hypothetical protein